MKIALVGKTGSINHWLEDAAGAWRGLGHEVRVAATRRPWLAAPVETALAGPVAEHLRARLTRFAPDLIVAIGAYHAPLPLLAAIADLPGRAPLAGWVGDVFAEDDRARAGLFDLVAYTDSALAARHREWAFPTQAHYLPHAIDPRAAAQPQPFGDRSPRMVFVANPTPGRQAVVDGIDTPVALYGPRWKRNGPVAHQVHRRVAARRVPAILAARQMALNMRNEFNVLSGLNQRNFEPCLAGAALITDDQPDLESCFDAGSEVLVWRDTAELNALYARLRGEPAFAARIAERGRSRVLAHHTYAHRLAAMAAALGVAPS